MYPARFPSLERYSAEETPGTKTNLKTIQYPAKIIKIIIPNTLGWSLGGICSVRIADNK
jgi:hypothetical protein